MTIHLSVKKASVSVLGVQHRFNTDFAKETTCMAAECYAVHSLALRFLHFSRDPPSHDFMKLIARSV
jgi:hypothetical protein